MTKTYRYSFCDTTNELFSCDCVGALEAIRAFNANKPEWLHGGNFTLDKQFKCCLILKNHDWYIAVTWK